MRFSPLVVSALLVKPLRYFFTSYAAKQGLIWSKDEKISTIDIGNINDFNKVALQQKPRILIDRGSYQIVKTGLTDNLAEAKGIKESYGATHRTNLVFISGQASIIIEARNEGTCDLIADMVSHFLVWSRPLLCDTQGFKDFGLPMNVTSCSPNKEDIEKFQITISFPYMMEEDWMVNFETLKLKGFFATLEPWDAPEPKQIIMNT